ncbi:hypothetical protein M3650_26585 [Paenibacillus sp. MER TA 81-3]|nr:hypothetical protein [Paenibacillus sp. MER TA 81-3]
MFPFQKNFLKKGYISYGSIDSQNLYYIQNGYVLRSSNPSLSGAVLGLLYKGDMVNTGHSEAIYADGYAWKSVYSYKHNTWGWVVADYMAER